MIDSGPKDNVAIRTLWGIFTIFWFVWTVLFVGESQCVAEFMYSSDFDAPFYSVDTIIRAPKLKT